MNLYKLTVQLKTGNIIVGYVSASEDLGPNNISSKLLMSAVDFFIFYDMKGQLFNVSPSAVASMTVSLSKRDIDDKYAQLFSTTIIYTTRGGSGRSDNYGRRSFGSDICADCC